MPHGRLQRRKWVQSASRLRGSLHFADAFFPMSLMHGGHWENQYTGYQMVFMMNLVLAGLLLCLILTTDRRNLLRRGIETAIVIVLLCGAGGLAYGPFMGLWLIAIALWSWQGKTKSASHWRVAILLGLTTVIPLYVGLYSQNYRHPPLHPDPVEVWGSRSAAVNRPQERPRLLGLLLFLSSTALVAFGIGWGRCGFTDGGHPDDMSFASRYGWIVWPGLGVMYFQWLTCGGRHLSRWGPIVVFGIVVFLLPFNVSTGFQQGKACALTTPRGKNRFGTR
jgi:hypothetical protein